MGWRYGAEAVFIGAQNARPQAALRQLLAGSVLEGSVNP